MADTEDITYQSQKLQKILPEYLGKDLSVLGEVQSLLREQSYARATALIQDFIQDFSRLATYEDPEIPALKLEIRMLEIRLSSLQDEQSDLEKLIRTFQIRHDQELGELVLQILALRKKKAQAEAQAEPENEEKQEQKQEAESDYEQFHQEYKTHKKKKIQELEAEEQKELKKLYRQATKICFPDIVPEEHKEKAQEIFVELDAAYKEQDLKRVQEIHENLQKGIFETQSKRIHEKQKLYALLKDLEQKIEQITQTLQEIQASETLQKIQSIKDWDAYFAETKGILEEELEDLKTDAF